MLRSCIVGLFIAFTLPLVAWVTVEGIDRSETIKWVGATDLEVEFLVTEADSGKPIANARLLVRNEGGFYDGGWENLDKPFELRTDPTGQARRLCRNNRCIGTQSRLRFTDTHVVYVPRWHVRVSADGYEASQPLDVHERYRGRVVHEAPLRDKLTLQISLKRAGSNGG